jgi:CRP-like cAMP-binding protein
MSSSSPLPELPAIGFLADVEASHREFLASYGRFVRLASGEFLIEEGKDQKSLYLILSGMLHVVTNATERPILVAQLGAGDSLGEINIFDPATASATVIARSECLIWRLSSEELDSFFEADPVAGLAFTKGLLKISSKRIRALIAKLAESQEIAAIHSFWKADA